MKKKIDIILSFVTGQFLLQGSNALIGLLLLRWLSIAEQAKFAIVFGVQVFLLMIIDVGITDSILALAGPRAKEAPVLGEYIKCANYFRNRFFLICTLVSVFLLPSYLSDFKWTSMTVFFLFLPVLISIFFQFRFDYYTIALRVHGKLNSYYSPQVYMAIIRMCIFFCAYLLDMINAMFILWINALFIVISTLVFRQLSFEFIKMPKHVTLMYRRQLIAYLKPVLPLAIFNSFQSQIILFIVTIFGNTTKVAQVSALSRLGAIFVFMSAFNYMVLAPYVAQATDQTFRKRIIPFIFLSLAILICFCVFASAFPSFFTFLLGEKYQNLVTETKYYIYSCVIYFFSTVLGTICTVRRWVYWWHTTAYITGILICQFLCVRYLNLSTALNVVIFAIFTNSYIAFIGSFTFIFSVFTKLNNSVRSPAKGKKLLAMNETFPFNS